VSVAEPEPEPEPEAEAEPVVVAEAPPEPVPEREPEPESEPELEPEPVAASSPPRADEPPRQWNLWTLETVLRDSAPEDEELSFLLMYLREFAGPDGLLPVDFDSLVRDSFGDLIATGRS
jgi:hypothetical protein